MSIKITFPDGTLIEMRIPCPFGQAGMCPFKNNY